MIVKGANGNVRDVGFNRPAKDGDKYTDEGIYTITVKNRYTNQETIKEIYVGTNAAVRADGAVVYKADGQVLIKSTNDTNAAETELTANTQVENIQNENVVEKGNNSMILILLGSVCLIAIGISVYVVSKKAKKAEYDVDNNEEKEQ